MKKKILIIFLYCICHIMILSAFEISLEYQLTFSDVLNPLENKKEDFFLIDGLDYIDKETLYGAVRDINYALQQTIYYPYVSLGEFTLYDTDCFIGVAFYDVIKQESILVKIDLKNKKIIPIVSVPKKNPEDTIKDIYLYDIYGEFIIELFDMKNIANNQANTYFLKYNYFSDTFETENMIDLNKSKAANKWQDASEKYTFESSFYKKVRLQTIQDEKTLDAFQDSFLEDSIYKINILYQQENLTLKDKSNDAILVYDSNFPITIANNKMFIGSNFGTTQNEYNNFRLYVYHIIYDGGVNDSRVRLRSEPNLNCDTLGYVNTGDKVKILDRSYTMQKIDNMNNFWYKVELADGTTGWVYGAYVDVEVQ